MRDKAAQCAAVRRWYSKRKQDPEFRERWRQSRREYREKHRMAVLAAYSQGTMMCACCGEDYRPFLTLDHINQDGAAHRRSVGGSNDRIYRQLSKAGFPPGYRVLCGNCNSRAYVCGGECDCP